MNQEYTLKLTLLMVVIPTNNKESQSGKKSTLKKPRAGDIFN